MALAPRDDGRVQRPAARTAPELAVLLLELARIVKARRFYGPRDAQLAAVFERALRAWRTDLVRHGALALEIRPDGFREAGGQGVLTHARLGELLADLSGAGVQTLIFEADMDGDALAGFAELLAGDRRARPAGGSFAEQLHARVPIGIAATSGAAAPAPAAVAAAPRPAAAGAPPVQEVPTEPLVDEVEPVTLAEAQRAARKDAARKDAGAPLDPLLAELGDCDSASSYQDLARRAVTEVERAADAELALRVMDRLATDADSKEERLGDIARSFLRKLCSDARLGGLLDRVANAEGAQQVRAVQILTLVGEPAAAAVIELLPSFPERVQRERLMPLLLALGDQAVPELIGRLDRPEPEIARSAAHLLGMLQHPAAVPRLAELSVGPDPAMRDEAARALVRIGSEEAVAALARGLRGRTSEVAIAAVQHLAATASPRAVAPLGHALERALEAKDVELAKEIVRALGRLGRPEVNVIFGSLMKRKVGFANRWLRDLKVIAASSLATVPGDQAVALLAEALQSRDEQLVRAAQRALDRRAESVARSAVR